MDPFVLGRNVCLSVCPFVYLCVCQHVLSSISVSARLPFRTSVCLPVGLSFCLSVYRSVLSSICVSADLFPVCQPGCDSAEMTESLKISLFPLLARLVRTLGRVRPTDTRITGQHLGACADCQGALYFGSRCRFAVDFRENLISIANS